MALMDNLKLRRQIGAKHQNSIPPTSGVDNENIEYLKKSEMTVEQIKLP